MQTFFDIINVMKNQEPEWAKYITEDSIDDPDVKALIALIGFEATKKLMIHYAGIPITIPKLCLTKYKHQYILDTYDGSKKSRIKLVRECNITENYIYKIANKYKNRKAF